MGMWTTKLARHFIPTRFGIEYCRERVRQLLHELGFRWRRLRHRHLRTKMEEQAAFVSELETWLADWAGGLGAAVCRGGHSASPSDVDRPVVRGR